MLPVARNALLDFSVPRPHKRVVHQALTQALEQQVARHAPRVHLAPLLKSQGNARQVHHRRWAPECAVRAHQVSFLVQGPPLAHNVPQVRRAALLKSRGNVRLARHRRWAWACAVLAHWVFFLARVLPLARNVLPDLRVLRLRKRHAH